jgi:membrane glycosyltransferase
MDFVDAVLYIMYIVSALAIGGVAWSAYRRNRRRTGRLAVQNGIHARRLDLIVWTSLLAIAVVTLLIGGGSVVDAIVLTLMTVLIASLAVAFWSFVRKK